MAKVQSMTWGKTQIKYFAGNLPEKEVRKAANLVSPSFETLPDSFVVLDKDGPTIFSLIPTKPKPTQFAVPIKAVTEPDGGVQAAMRKALEKAANFLKDRV